MILFFPDRETLALALTSGELPEEITLAEADVAYEEDGIVVRTEVDANQRTRRRLRDLGVKGRRGIKNEQRVGSWLELLPLTPDASTIPGGGDDAVAARTPVLFELQDPTRLPEFVGEMLRLGNDRQSYRHIETESDSDSEAAPTALLRVMGPPYYSLLRALEREGRTWAPIAYIEQSQRVWVEVGFSHPLAEKIIPPAGSLLLIQSSGTWRFIREDRFRDIYEILQFTIPQDVASLEPAESVTRLEVPLGMTRGGSDEPTKLWVLRKEPLKQIDEFAATASDRLLERLSFAVVEDPESATEPAMVLLRARPGRDAPPVLVLDAVEMAPYLKLDYLFLPVGQRLHPPLRRDAVKDLLAADNRKVTWLLPDEEEGFTPQSVADTAFRPLSDWVDYVIERDKQQLETWAQAFEFDFDDFICPEEDEERRARQERRARPERDSAGDQSSRPARPPKERPKKDDAAADKADSETSPDPDTGPVQATMTFPEAEPSEYQTRLHDLEEEFLAVDLPPDAPERLPMWREMATLNARLGQSTDATICWSNVIWDQQGPSRDDLWNWYLCEWQPEGRAEPSSHEIDSLLDEETPAPNRLVGLFAWLAWVGSGDDLPTMVVERLPKLQAFLETHESALSLRTTWIGWRGLNRIAGGDELTLARARDRMLERLYVGGISPDQELPSFLRASGLGGSGERFRIVRDRILAMHQRFETWRQTQSPSGSGAAAVLASAMAQGRTSDYWTSHYVELIFAWAYARMGESVPAKALWEEAHSAMLVDEKTGVRRRKKHKPDAVHHWAQEAYGFRINEGLTRSPIADQLPVEVLSLTEKFDRNDTYRIEFLLRFSEILEPHEEKDGYRHFRLQESDPLGQELITLVDLSDRNELSRKIGELVARYRASGTPEQRGRLLKTALEISPRVGESFALGLLTDARSVAVEEFELQRRIELIEKALHISAHFAQPELVREFVQLIESSFESLTRLSGKNRWNAFRAFEKLLTRAVRGLRKLGLRDEISSLLDRMALAVLKEYATGEPDDLPEDAEGLHLLLSIVSGWFYFGHDKRCWPVLRAVYAKLVDEAPIGPMDKLRIPLCCSFVHAVSQAPVEEAIVQMEQLFESPEEGGLIRITDHGTTASHYLISQIRVAEAVAIALVSDDFSLDRQGRMWLDDDEYRIRRRVHRDVNASAE